MNLRTREALLGAIAKARVWIDDLVQGRIKSFSEIAMRESKVERGISGCWLLGRSLPRGSSQRLPMVLRHPISP
jgi:hypothetical protein